VRLFGAPPGFVHLFLAHATVSVVQHLWTVIDEDAERATNNQSVPHNVEEIKDIFASLLKIFEVCKTMSYVLE